MPNTDLENKIVGDPTTRDEPSVFDLAEEEEDKVEMAALEDGGDGGEGVEDPPESSDDPEIEAARALLLERGTPENALSGLSDDELLNWANSGPEPEDEVDKILAALRTPADQTEPNLPGVDFEEISLSGLDDLLGAEAGSALTGAMTKLQTSTKAAMQKQANTIQFLSNLLEQRIVGEVRTNLAKEYPDISKDGDFAKVEELAKALSATGRYKSIEDTMKDAAAVVFKGRKTTATGMREKLARQKRNGAMKVTKRGKSSKQLSNADVSDRIALLVAQGKMDEARRLSDQF